MLKQIHLILKGVLKEGGKPVRYICYKSWNVAENGSVKKASRVPYYKKGVLARRCTVRQEESAVQCRSDRTPGM